ncbi:hypothetical protein CN408_27090 [Bacillus cereus]|nr:hypothetical protein CN408_27090 [Bacillus cereus]
MKVANSARNPRAIRYKKKAPSTIAIITPIMAANVSIVFKLFYKIIILINKQRSRLDQKFFKMVSFYLS